MEYFWLVILGLLTGISGGLLGIGGSVVMIPGLVLLYGPERQHLYQAAAMMVNFFVVAPAMIRHIQANASFSAVTRWLIPSAVIGSVGGVFLSELKIFRGPGQGYLQLLFAVFLAYVIAYNIARIKSGQRLAKMTSTQAAQLSKFRISTLVGLPAGLLGGLLGVGGGLIAVPAQQIALRIPLTNAIANSAGMIMWSSIVGAIAKNSRLSQHGFTIGQAAMLAVCLAPSAVIASYYSAAKVHQWPVKIIRVAFVALLLYCSIRIGLAGWQQVTHP